MNIHALWCHPRSVSTAFERVMRARGDMDVAHEPFMYHYYFNRSDRMFPGFEPEDDHPRTYAEVREMLLSRGQDGPVFFKDMAYYVLVDLIADTEFAAQMTHAFLIRDPAEAILSYHRLDPEFACVELGHEAQFRFYSHLVELGQKPLVILSSDLRAQPEPTMRRYWDHVGLPFVQGAFSWDDSVPEGWQSVAKWHGGVLQSGGIKAANSDVDAPSRLAALGAPFTNYDRHHRPFYEALAKVAREQTHQK